MDNRYPHLAGQKRAYLVSRLQGFRAGTQPYNLMNAQAAGLSDADIDSLAGYFSTLPSFSAR